MTLVTDASALVVALLGATAPAEALRRRIDVDVCHAPHLVDAEIGHVLRRRVLRGEMPAITAEVLLRRSESLVDHRHRMSGTLAHAAWALRANLTFYDALYAALAAALDCPLLTADVRLSHAPGLPCAIELVVE